MITNYNPLHKNRRKNLEQLRTGDGRSVPAHLKSAILREIDRLELVLRQVGESKLNAMKCCSWHNRARPPHSLMRLKGIGAEFATVLYFEGLFRRFEDYISAKSWRAYVQCDLIATGITEGHDSS